MNNNNNNNNNDNDNNNNHTPVCSLNNFKEYFFSAVLTLATSIVRDSLPISATGGEILLSSS